MTRSLAIGIALFLAGMCVAGVGTYYALSKTEWGNAWVRESRSDTDVVGEDDESAGDCAPSADQVTALARLEPAQGLISINGTPGDRLDHLSVKLDDRVQKGQLLAVLESHAIRKTELKLAETQLAEAHARMASEERYADAMLAEVALAESQARLEKHDRDAQAEKVAGLEAAYRTAQADLVRLQRVKDSAGAASDDEIVSQQQLEHQRLARDKAHNELSAAQAELEKLQQGVELADQEARAKRKTAQANRERAITMVQIGSLEQQVELARRRLELTELRAPSDGKILKVFLNDGDTLTQQPVLQIADVDHIVAVAEIYEDDVQRIEPEARACVSSKALAAPLLGTVSTIGQIVAKNTVVGLDPTESMDKRVVEARIVLDRAGEGTQADPLGRAAGKLTAGAAYLYKITFADGPGQSESLPSPPIGPIVLAAGQTTVQLKGLPTDSRGIYQARRLYRTKANGTSYHLVCELPDNRSDYEDTAADDDLGDSPAARPLVNLQVNARISAQPEAQNDRSQPNPR